MSIDLIFLLRVYSGPRPARVNEVVAAALMVLRVSKRRSRRLHCDTRAYKSDKADYLTQDNSYLTNQE